jgi:pimeloyl-ACP methyl ester carboxylesterase
MSGRASDGGNHEVAEGRAAVSACHRDLPVGQAAALGYCLYPGRSPALILLSGLGNDMRSWSPPFLDALNRLAGVLIYDRRGYGQSAPLPPAPVTAQAAAAELDKLLQALDFSAPVVLVGHSLGGLYAQYFARKYPRQVAAVVLIDSASPFEPIDDPRFRTRSALKGGTVEYYENAGIDRSILETRGLPPFPPVPLVVLTAIDHASTPDFEREWQQIQAKVAAQSAFGRQVIVEGSGHYIQDDQPDLVIDLISRLLLQLRSKSQSANPDGTSQ